MWKYTSDYVQKVIYVRTNIFVRQCWVDADTQHCSATFEVRPVRQRGYWETRIFDSIGVRMIENMNGSGVGLRIKTADTVLGEAHI